MQNILKKTPPFSNDIMFKFQVFCRDFTSTLFFFSSTSFCFCSSAIFFSSSKSSSLTNFFCIAPLGGGKFCSLEKYLPINFLRIFFSIFPRFKFQVEIVSHVHTSFFNKAMDFRVGACVNILKYLLIFN